MREIKFRGRRVDNGEWVYGLPKYGSGGNINYICGWFGESDNPLYDEIEVSSITVWQYIGLKDKNRVELYEGDRIRFLIKEINGNGPVKETRGMIRWDDEDAGFFIENDDDRFPHVKLYYAYDYELLTTK